MFWSLMIPMSYYYQAYGRMPPTQEPGMRGISHQAEVVEEDGPRRKRAAGGPGAGEGAGRSRQEAGSREDGGGRSDEQWDGGGRRDECRVQVGGRGVVAGRKSHERGWRREAAGYPWCSHSVLTWSKTNTSICKIGPSYHAG